MSYFNDMMKAAVLALSAANELAKEANAMKHAPVGIRLRIAKHSIVAARCAASAYDVGTCDYDYQEAQRMFDQAMTSVRVWSDIPAGTLEDLAATED